MERDSLWSVSLAVMAMGLNLASNANWGNAVIWGVCSNKAGEKQYVNIANENLILADKDHVLVSTRPGCWYLSKKFL